MSKNRTLAAMIAKEAKGVNVEYIDTVGANYVRAFYLVGTSLIAVKLVKLEELYQRFGIERQTEPVDLKCNDTGAHVKLDSRSVDQYSELQERVHGATGAEELKEFITPKRLASALYELCEEEGVMALAALLSHTTEPEA